MYRAKFFTSMDDIEPIRRVRAEICELNATNDDARDLLAVFVLAYDEQDAPCGCGRMYIDGDSHFRIDQLGVLSEWRGLGIGDLLARMLLYRAQELNAGSVYLACPRCVEGFFARYGFLKLSEARAEEEIVMRVAGDAIRLEGKCHLMGTDACGGHCEDCGAQNAAPRA